MAKTGAETGLRWAGLGQPSGRPAYVNYHVDLCQMIESQIHEELRCKLDHPTLSYSGGSLEGAFFLDLELTQLPLLSSVFEILI